MVLNLIKEINENSFGNYKDRKKFYENLDSKFKEYEQKIIQKNENQELE
jgi:hypothetical protein